MNAMNETPEQVAEMILHGIPPHRLRPAYRNVLKDAITTALRARDAYAYSAFYDRKFESEGRVVLARRAAIKALGLEDRVIGWPYWCEIQQEKDQG